MDLSGLDRSALTRALDDPDPDREHFFEPGTGSLWTFVFSEATDETRRRHDEILSALGRGWIRIPSPSPREAYEDAEDFVESIAGEDVREALFSALERRGSLKDFRGELMRHPDERARWLGTQRERSARRLEGFLVSLERTARPDGVVP